MSDTKQHLSISEQKRNIEKTLPHKLGYSDIILKSRVDTKCDECKKLIPKGSQYFRRSFGMKWTWKACKVECALKLIERSILWT